MKLNDEQIEGFKEELNSRDEPNPLFEFILQFWAANIKELEKIDPIFTAENLNNCVDQILNTCDEIKNKISK